MRFRIAGPFAREAALAVVCLWCAWTGSVFVALGAVIVWAAVSFAVYRASCVTPTLGGGRITGPRYKLEAMPVTHFGESIRFALDVLDLPYDEEDNVGLATFFLMGMSVPRLHDRLSLSVIGNSNEIMQYLAGRLAPSLPGRPAAAALLARSAATQAWEKDLDLLGHSVQRYGYHHILGYSDAGTHDKRLPLSFWGAYDPSVPYVQRTFMKVFYPVFRRAMMVGMSLTKKSRVEGAYQKILAVMDRADRALATPLSPEEEAEAASRRSDGGPRRFLTGPRLNFVDVKFCALLGPFIGRHLILQQPNGRGSVAAADLGVGDMYARGQFDFARAFPGGSAGFVAAMPAALLDLEETIMARPCGQFAVDVYRAYRSSKFV